MRRFLLVSVLLALSLRPTCLFLFRLMLAEPDENLGSFPVLAPKDLNFKGKRAVLIGGTRGVGYGIALALAQGGASVTIVGRNAETGQAAVEKIGAERTTYLQGDIGTIQSAFALVQELEQHGPFDILVNSAAVFPNWKADSLLQEDGLDRSFAIAVMGRYIVYRQSHQFMNDMPVVLNIMASGSAQGHRFHQNRVDRELVTGSKTVTSLFQSLMFWSLANEIMLIGLFRKGILPESATLVTTHPGLLKTDLHGDQGVLFDILEAFMVALVGVSEEECGVRHASILMDDRLYRGKITYVDQFMEARVAPPILLEEADEHLDWLLQFLDSKIVKARGEEAGQEEVSPASETAE